MARLTIIFGTLLVALGIVGYLATGHQHPTALIPAYFGVLLTFFGLLANTEDTKKRMLWMHIAVTIGLLGFLGTAAAIIDMYRLLRGVQFPYPAAVESKTAMAILCLIFVILCVKSFIFARRSRIQ